MQSGISIARILRDSLARQEKKLEKLCKSAPRNKWWSVHQFYEDWVVFLLEMDVIRRRGIRIQSAKKGPDISIPRQKNARVVFELKGPDNASKPRRDLFKAILRDFKRQKKQAGKGRKSYVILLLHGKPEIIDSYISNHLEPGLKKHPSFKFRMNRSLPPIPLHARRGHQLEVILFKVT